MIINICTYVYMYICIYVLYVCVYVYTFLLLSQTDTSTTYKTQSVKVTSDYVRFAAEATFAVTSPVPEVKIQMYNTQGGFMSDGKVLAKVSL